MCHCVPQRERTGNPFGNLNFMMLLSPDSPFRLTGFSILFHDRQVYRQGGGTSSIRRVGGRVLERGTPTASLRTVRAAFTANRPGSGLLARIRFPQATGMTKNPLDCPGKPPKYQQFPEWGLLTVRNLLLANN